MVAPINSWGWNNWGWSKWGHSGHWAGEKKDKVVTTLLPELKEKKSSTPSPEKTKP